MRFCSPICTQTTGPAFIAGTLLSQLLFISSSLIIRIFPHNSVALARLYPLHIDTSMLMMIRAHLQYSAIVHGKESHHE
jgi:uncharacterized membrane protein